jgi:hypothetical protein
MTTRDKSSPSNSLRTLQAQWRAEAALRRVRGVKGFLYRLTGIRQAEAIEQCATDLDPYVQREIAQPQTGEEPLTHVDSLRQSAQQATGGRITLIRTDVVRDLLLYLDNTDVNGQFEAIAEKFYQDTGWLRPGKSVPLAMAEKYQGNERDVVWREWCERWRARLIAALSAGLPSAREATLDGSVSLPPEGKPKDNATNKAGS